MTETSLNPVISYTVLDVVRKVLALSGNVQQVADHITLEVRKLTGASSVALFRQSALGEEDGRLISFNPARRKSPSNMDLMGKLLKATREMARINLIDFSGNKIAAETGPCRPGVETAIVAPLCIEEHRVGVLIAMGLPDRSGISFILNSLETVMGTVALALRNAFLMEEQERIIGERTRDLENAVRDVEAASKAKSVFLANMSHELRTPLNAILGFAQIFQRKPDLDPAFREGIDIIHDSGEHLLSLITDILDSSKIDAGKMELLPEEISLPALINNIAAIGRSHAAEKGLEFHLDLKGALPSIVEADAKRLRQVLLNLLSNALKFTESGSVVLRIHAQGDGEQGRQRIRFGVIDTGIGISEQQQARIFEPFAQAAKTRFKVDGTGLGLSISRRLVRLMGGDLELASRPGRGSTFSFSLAFRVTHSEPATCAVTAGIIDCFGGQRKVLVVDDNSDNRMLLANMLRPLGFIVLEADSGADAIDMAMTEQLHLIIMDLIMPDLDGLEATRRIRRRKATRHIPIIACSASTFDEDRNDCREAGCNGFLPKPVNIQELLRLLAQELDLSGQTSCIGDKTAVPPEVIVPPEAHKLEELRKLAFYGNMRKICRWAENLAAEQPDVAPFCNRIATMAKKYQEQKIMDFIDYYSAGEKADDIA